MKIILAIDSFKGCFSSEEVEAILAEAFGREGFEVCSVPMSDGGEGMLEAFIAALNGRYIEATVHDPLMRPVGSKYGIAADGTAVIETARACGLTLMSPAERNPLVATTYGVGELIADAVHRGCRRFIIGLGGSGTSDAGRGMLQALADAFTPNGELGELAESGLKECCFTLASDVRNPLYGENGAARVFGPQKGATPEMVPELDRRARDFARQAALLTGKDLSLAPGAGAAGGLGYAFMQFLEVRAQSGADLLLDVSGFEGMLEQADLIITGEGSADRQTLMGKLPERVLQRGLKHGVPVWLVAGRTQQVAELQMAGFARVDCITPPSMCTEEAIRPANARKHLEEWVARVLPELKR